MTTYSYLDSTGLHVKTVQEVIDDLTAGMQAVYGTDINVDSNSPDGQLINLFAQAIIDLLELSVVEFNSFDPNQAFGTILDQRVALNGVTRQAATFTLTNVSITVDRALNLQGLDADIDSLTGTGFTVADGSGTQFILTTSQTIAVAGTYVLAFRAANIGPVQTTPNTITNPVTIIAGVTAINNPTSSTSVGLPGETDTQLKLRRLASFKLASISPADAVRAALLNISGVTDCWVQENNATTTVGTVPAHSIWPIVEGGSDADIALAIYSKKAPGCGLKGSASSVVTRPQGNTITINFDRPSYDNLYMAFTLTARVPGTVFDTTYIKSQLASLLSYKLNQVATANDIVLLIYQIQPDAIVTSCGVSLTAGSYTETLTPSSPQHKFLVSTARMAIS